MDFFYELFYAETPFLRCTLIAGLLAAVSFGIVGCVVVTQRISSIAGAVGHAVLGGVGLAFFAQRVLLWHFFTPLLGAVIAAVGSSLLMFAAKKYAKEREDTVIGAIWALGMSAGLLLLAKTPGYVDLQGVLFGNIMLLTGKEIAMLAVLGAVVLAGTLIFFNPLLAVCFDRDFARLRGINVEIFDLAILIVTSLTVVLLVNVVGIILVIALLTLPAATAGCVCKRFSGMMLWAVFFSMLMICAGVFAGFTYDLPTGSAIVFCAVILYLLMTAGTHLFRRIGAK